MIRTGYTVSKRGRSLCKWRREQGEGVAVKKKEALLRVTKNRKLFRAMIGHVCEGTRHIE